MERILLSTYDFLVKLAFVRTEMANMLEKTVL